MNALTVCIDRLEYLELLLEAPRSKCDIVAAVEKSRSTVDRDVRLLEQYGVIERADEGYRTTTTGRIVLDDLAAFVGRFECALDAQDVLDLVPVDAPLAPACLEDATIVRPEPHAPDLPVQVFLEHLDGARRLRGFSPVVLTDYVDRFRELIVEEGARTELILTGDVLDRLVSVYAAEFQEVIETGRYAVYETDSLPYGLCIVECDDRTTVLVALYSEHGAKSVIVTESTAAFEWAEAVYESFREEAECRIEG